MDSPMADPTPPPEAVGAGPGLVINNDQAQSAFGSDSRDCVGSNNPSYHKAAAAIGIARA